MQRKVSKCFAMVIVLTSSFILIPSQGYAYLDPGTGSLMLQGILGGLAIASVVGRRYWHQILNIIGVRKKNLKDSDANTD